MKKDAVLIVLAALLLGGLSVFGQEDESQSGGDAAQQESAPAPGESEPSEPVSDDIFIPSEEVQAAEELAFPVNI
jgi:hypothetical protein